MKETELFYCLCSAKRNYLFYINHVLIPFNSDWTKSCFATRNFDLFLLNIYAIFWDHCNIEPKTTSVYWALILSERRCTNESGLWLERLQFSGRSESTRFYVKTYGSVSYIHTGQRDNCVWHTLDYLSTNEIYCDKQNCNCISCVKVYGSCRTNTLFFTNI